MQINVTTRNVHLKKEQHEWIRRRLQFALGRFVSRIGNVTVILSNVNAARGRADKKCRLRISLLQNGEVVVEDIDTSVETVAAIVVERAGRSVARAVQTLRDFPRETERVINMFR